MLCNNPSTGGPRYTHPYYLRFCLFAIQYGAFFSVHILQFYLYLGIFIRGFLICDPKYHKDIYSKLGGKVVLLD
jgi:hypothetical protein